MTNKKSPESLKKSRRLYLCCLQSERPFYQEKAKEVYKGMPVTLVDRVEEGDVILVVGNRKAEMDADLIKATRLGTPIQYVDQNLMSQTMKEALLTNTPRHEQPTAVQEQCLSYEYER